ncbi:hypothetical protein [Kiloniella laminariae]|uniref:hypothetical protein n=1 Tax=Kiloniella laminariae TaxID=454162 RepID=UPI0003817376|nr:hypothetical protein [Kiloniella laminariae]
MKKIATLLWGVSVLALGAAAFATSAAQAASGTSEYVLDVDLTLGAGNAQNPVIVRNISNNKHVSNVNLKTHSTELVIPASGFVQCGDKKSIDFDKSSIYFGAIGMGGLDNINDSGALHKATFHPAVKTRIGLGKWITEAGGSDSFSVPLAKIENGHPAVRLDPVAEINKKLQAHLQGGGTEVDFYKADQTVTISRTISLAGWCKKSGSSKPGFETKSYQVSIRYEGDPEVHAPVKVKPGLVGQNLQINQDLPLQLAQATFQPNLPNYVGKCAPDSNPTIRVNYNGSGAGWVRFQIKDGSASVYGSSDMLYISEQLPQAHFDFDYPLIEKLGQNQNADWNTINKTFNHALTVRAQVKDKNSNSWSAWKDFGAATWKHRCTPQIAVNPAAGGKVYQIPSKPSARPISPAKPAPVVIDTIQAQPKPKRLQVQAPE